MKELEKLSASPKSKAIVVVILGFTFIFAYLFKEHWYAYSAIIIVTFSVSILFAFSVSILVESYHLNEKFIKKIKEKLLREDIVDVKQLLWYRIVTDKYGDSMWINYASLRKEDKEKLNDWLTQ